MNNSGQPSVVITSNQYRPNIGGIENSLYHLAQEYRAMGYQVIIVTSDLNPDNSTLPDLEEEQGVRIYRYRSCQGTGAFGFIKHINNAYRVYKKVLSLYSPDFTVCRFHFNLLILKYAGYKNIVYLVPGVVKNETRASYQVETTLTRKIKSGLSFSLHKVMQYFATKFTDQLFVFSENMREQVLTISSLNNIKICKPGVSLERFQICDEKEKANLKLALGLDANRKAFLCIGRFVKAKGFETAIKAFAELRHDSAQLWMLGEGPLEAEFKVLVAELGVEDKVLFLGKQAQPEAYYKAADFFIMSSTYEPLGQTILEALASGLPIVAAHSGPQVVTATSEILTDSDNLLCSEYSTSHFGEQFTECMNMTSDRYLKIQKSNRNLAETRFSWFKLAEDLRHHV